MFMTEALHKQIGEQIQHFPSISCYLQVSIILYHQVPSDEN